jgi:uncharacterized protein (DUF1501 family)
MKRRDFLKLAGIWGAGALAPMVSPLKLYAAASDYTGPLWITLEARGGWDPSSFCDPKGYLDPADPARINNYPAAGIEQVGNFFIAPPPDSFLSNTELYTTKQFIQAHGDRLLVVNGIDIQTNAHSDGQRHTWSGELAQKGFPNVGALIANVLAGSKAMPFVTNGGYSEGGNLLTPVRVDNRSISAVAEIAYPNHSQGKNSTVIREYYSPEVLDLITRANAQRLTALQESQRLPRIKTAMEKLQLARSTTDGLTGFVDNLAQNPERPLTDFNNRTKVQAMYQQARIALAAYETGVSAAAHISVGGFDTHSNHDLNHYPLLMDFLQGIDVLIQEAKSRGLEDRIVIIVGSDFGRTNKYNAGDGKDHWPVTSMMFMGNSINVIRGNRVLGKTSSEQKALKIDPLTLQADDNDTNPQSIRITPAHIHRALRKLAGVDLSPAATTKFGLKGSDIDFFS